MNIMFKFLNEKILISFALRYAQKKIIIAGINEKTYDFSKLESNSVFTFFYSNLIGLFSYFKFKKQK